MDKIIEQSNTVRLVMEQATKEQKKRFDALVDDDKLLDAYIIYIQDDECSPNTKEIGVVWHGLYGWNTVPYVGDLGHCGFDTLEEATKDLYSVWNEWHSKKA